MRLIAIALLALAPMLASAQVACGSGMACPPGTICQGGFCVQSSYPQQQQGYAQPQVYQQPVQSGTPRIVERPNIGLIVTGAVLLGVGWITNIFTSLFAGYDLFGSAASSEWDSFRLMGVLPLLGPWVQLGLKPTSFSQDNWGTWLIIDGILQVGGLALLVIGILTPSQRTVYARNQGLEWSLLPVASPSFAGLELLGRF